MSLLFGEPRPVNPPGLGRTDPFMEMVGIADHLPEDFTIFEGEGADPAHTTYRGGTVGLHTEITRLGPTIERGTLKASLIKIVLDRDPQNPRSILDITGMVSQDAVPGCTFNLETIENQLATGNSDLLDIIYSVLRVADRAKPKTPLFY